MSPHLVYNLPGEKMNREQKLTISEEILDGIFAAEETEKLSIEYLKPFNDFGISEKILDGIFPADGNMEVPVVIMKKNQTNFCKNI